MTSDAESFGKRIARLRQQRGWTQERLAERLAVSRVAVSHIEMGLSIPSERTVVLLAGLFDTEPHLLVAGSNYPDAKRERLPSVASRYTAAEQLRAVLAADLAWLAAGYTRPELRPQWLTRLYAAMSECQDPHELAILRELEALVVKQMV